MPHPAHLPRFLVVRPYLGHASREGAYAHLEALVMYSRGDVQPTRYGDLRPLLRWDDTPRPILHEGLRWSCQIDDRTPEVYGIHYGYTSEHADIFTAADLARYGRSIPALRRVMDRLQERDGPAGHVAVLLLRLARVLKVRGIALLEPRLGEAFFADDHRFRRLEIVPDYGPVFAEIGNVAAELHRHCAARCGCAAA